MGCIRSSAVMKSPPLPAQPHLLNMVKPSPCAVFACSYRACGRGTLFILTEYQFAHIISWKKEWTPPHGATSALRWLGGACSDRAILHNQAGPSTDLHTHSNQSPGCINIFTLALERLILQLSPKWFLGQKPFPLLFEVCPFS